MKFALVAGVFALVLVSCATADKTAITLCSGYAVTLSTLADFRASGKLSTGTIAAVDQARGVLNPICLTDPMPTTLDAATLAAATASIASLKTIITGVTP